MNFKQKAEASLKTTFLFKDIQTHSDPIRSIKEQIPPVCNEVTEKEKDEEERRDERDIQRYHGNRFRVTVEQ